MDKGQACFGTTENIKQFLYLAISQRKLFFILRTMIELQPMVNQLARLTARIWNSFESDTCRAIPVECMKKKRIKRGLGDVVIESEKIL